MKTKSPGRSEWSLDLAMAACIAALAVLLYLPIVKLYWLYDDAFHLLLISEARARDILFHRVFWDGFGSRLFTPLLFLSYRIDLSLFGFEPTSFYIHQFVSLAVAAIALYYLLRMWLPALFATTSCVIVMLGVAFGEWAELLMTRHYLDGLTFASLSTILFVLASRRMKNEESTPIKAILLTIGSALLFLIACLGKEIYVLLPFFLAILPEENIRTRARLLISHAVALMVYLAWRYSMLGTLLGGYGWSVRSEDWPRLIAALPVKFWNVLFGVAPFAGGVFLIIFLAALVVLTIRSRAALGRIAWAALLAIAPIIPVSTVLERRYAVLLWLLMAVVIALASQQLASRRKSLAAFMMLLAFAASVRLYAVERSRMFPLLEQMSAEGRGLLELEEGDVLRHPAIPPAAMNGLRMLSETSLGAKPGARWFYDDIHLCDPASESAGDDQVRSLAPSKRFWQYDAASDAIQEITSQVPRIAAAHCSSIRWDAPLRGEFVLEEGALHWTLGPYDSGTYSFVLDGGTQKYEMPREGGFRLGPVETLPLRLRYDAPEGWVTYSPEITLDFRATGLAGWERR